MSNLSCDTISFFITAMVAGGIKVAGGAHLQNSGRGESANTSCRGYGKPAGGAVSPASLTNPSEYQDSGCIPPRADPSNTFLRGGVEKLRGGSISGKSGCRDLSNKVEVPST